MMNLNQLMHFRATAYLRFNSCFLITALVYLVATTAMAQNTSCRFDPRTLQFNGDPLAQAKCLLRPNGKGGTLGVEPAKLPDPLEKLIGGTVKIKAAKLRAYLNDKKITEDTIGGSIDLPLAKAILPDGSAIEALYFIIHDTSTPNLVDADFPADLDSNPKARGNNLNVWINQPVAHVFVNRLGESLTATPFGETVRKGWGTKFARDMLKAEGKGLQIHIELVQPRRRDPASSNPNNDLIAPFPGFSDAQYERLALLYVAASVRRGTWLIPAYHSAIDAGIKDAHDDPQNFDLAKFASALKSLLKDVR